MDLALGPTQLTLKTLASGDTPERRTCPITTLHLPCNMDYRDRITIDPGKRSGKPCIRGLRITVYDVLDYLAGGMSEDEILADFPQLEREDIRAAIAFAADRERRLIADPAA